MTQLALDVIFRSLGHGILDCVTQPGLEGSIGASDASESGIFAASSFLETVFGESSGPSRPVSRAPTPMLVRPPPVVPLTSVAPSMESAEADHVVAAMGPGLRNRPASVRIVRPEDYAAEFCPPPGRAGGGCRRDQLEDDSPP